MSISLHMLAIIMNDIFLIVVKKTNDKYSNSTCQSKCCTWNWNFSMRRSQTMNTIKSE